MFEKFMKLFGVQIREEKPILPDPFPESPFNNYFICPVGTESFRVLFSNKKNFETLRKKHPEWTAKQLIDSYTSSFPELYSSPFSTLEEAQWSVLYFINDDIQREADRKRDHQFVSDNPPKVY